MFVNFEQALHAELTTINNLNQKVFPLFAPEDTNAPFLIYQKLRVDFIKTFDGTTTTREGRFELDIITATYSDLQVLLADVKNKLVSFESRTIGTNGPFVQAITIENITEIFEEEVEFHRANIEFKTYFVEV